MEATAPGEQDEAVQHQQQQDNTVQQQDQQQPLEDKQPPQELSVEKPQEQHEVDKELPALRNDLIMTAVRFLENSKIRSTSTELKTTFLKKKGLTDEEIAAAFRQIKCQDDGQAKTMQTLPEVPPPVSGLEAAAIPPAYLTPFIPGSIVQSYPVSKKIRDVLNIILLIGGFTYGINYIWKKYIRSWWYGEKNESAEQILVHTSNTLLSTVLTLKEEMDKLQVSLDAMTSRGSKADNEVSDLKKEVMSLKTLLLSRRRGINDRRLSSTSSLLPRSPFVQSEPTTPFMTGLLSSPSSSGMASPGGRSLAGQADQTADQLLVDGDEEERDEDDMHSPELEFMANNGTAAAFNLMDEIDD